MHELSVVKNIMEVIENTLRGYENPKPEKINLKVGEFSGIVIDSLEFAFDAVKGETIFRDTELNVEIIPFRGSCNNCGKDFRMEDRFIMLCPNCGSEDVDVVSGRELLIDSVGIEEDE